jgi:hypothetical protein
MRLALTAASGSEGKVEHDLFKLRDVMLLLSDRRMLVTELIVAFLL